MSKGNSPTVRIDPALERHMKEIAKIRLDRGLAKLNPKDLSIREMTRLLTKTNGFKLSLEELKIKPKKKPLI